MVPKIGSVSQEGKRETGVELNFCWTQERIELIPQIING